MPRRGPAATRPAPQYVYRCSRCGKEFRHGRRDATLRAHKDRYGWFRARAAVATTQGLGPDAYGSGSVLRKVVPGGNVKRRGAIVVVTAVDRHRTSP
jgi:hypothetical protein